MIDGRKCLRQGRVEAGVVVGTMLRVVIWDSVYRGRGPLVWN